MGDDACGAFLVEPRDDMEEEAPELKNAVAIPLSDARGLRYALAARPAVHGREKVCGHERARRQRHACTGSTSSRRRA